MTFIKTITIFQTSDIHGHLFPTSYLKRRENQAFGLLKVASNYKAHKTVLPEDSTLFISNGDILQGSALSHFLYKQKGSGTTILNVMNEIGYEAAVPGNHEFNYGQAYLQEAYQAADFPLLCANILDSDGQPYFGQAYKIFERDGVKIAVLGLTTQFIPHWEHPKHIEGLTFQSAVECAQHYVPILNELADVTIVSYHGGFECNLDTLTPTDINVGENEGYALIKEVPGIDVLLTGHQHNQIARVIDGVAVVMPGDKGRFLGKVTLHLNKYEGDQSWSLVDAVPELIDTEETTSLYKSDNVEINALGEEIEDWLDQTVGRISGDMLIDDVDQARICDHPYIEFIHRVQNYYGQTEISAAALFNNQATGFSEQVTIRDILNNYPFPNTLAVVKVTGADIKAALELSAEFFMLDDQNQIVMSPEWLDPKPKLYNYDMYEGIQYTVDVSKAKGQRVVRLDYRYLPMDMDAEFEVTLNQYRAVGGGDYPMFDASKIIREVNIEMNQLIIQYLEQFKGIEATCNHNFKVVTHSENEN